MDGSSPRKLSRDVAFAPASRRRSGPTRPREWIALGVVPALIFAAHFAFGASVNVAAASLTVLICLALAAALCLPAGRAGLAEIRGLWIAAALMAAVIGVALLTLTDLTPGGAHPIWEWAGVDTRASTINRFQTTMEIIKLGGLAAIFLIGGLQGGRHDWARNTIKIVLAFGGVYAAFSLLGFLTGQQTLPGPRLSGGFMSANSGATVFGILAIVATGETQRLWRRYGSDRQQALARVTPAAALVILFAVCLLLTASRAGMTATLAAVAAVVIWSAFASGVRLSPKLLVGGLAFLALCALLMGGSGDLLWNRLGTVETDTFVRQTILTEHWKAFLASPLFGYGLGSFVDLNSMIMTPQTYGALLVGSAHNVYLQWLEEAGIVGSAPMFLLIGWLLIASAWGAHGARRGGETVRALVCANLVVLLHGITDFALQEFSIAAMWAFLLGLQFAWGAYRPRG